MSRKPDYRVGALDKATDEKATVGGAWINPDGTISIVLNSFVVLNANKSLLITLFPNEKEILSSKDEGVKSRSTQKPVKYDTTKPPWE